MKEKSAAQPVARALVAFTIPLILSGLFQQMFNWVDAFIVGNVEGELALAGIGATTSLYNLFVTVITGFTSGLTAMAAQRYGRGEKDKLVRTLSCYAVLLGGLFTVIAVAGAAGAGGLLQLMQTPENIFGDAQGYLRILFFGIPFLAVYNTYSAVLRGLGNSRAPFLSILVCSLVNVALDILFVAGLGYGAAGAAAATVIAQAAMTVFIVLYTVRLYPELRFSLFRPGFRGEEFREGSRFGLPPAVQSGVSSVGNVFLQQFMNGFGEQTVAAITTAYRVDTVLFLPIINFGSGIATIVAQHTGAGDQKLARRVFHIGSGMMVVIALALTLVVLLAGGPLISLFGLTEGSVEIGRSFFSGIARFYLIYGVSMAIRGYLEGTGDMVFSGAAGILSLGVRIICSYAFKPVFGNMVVAYAEGFSWIFMLALFAGRYFFRSRKERKNV